MPYNPALDEEAPPGEELDIQAIADEDRLNNLISIRTEVGDAGLSDEDMEFVAQYELDPMRAQEDFGANLAEFIEENELGRIANEVIETFDWDYESRKDWYEREVRGIRMLGVTSKTDGGANFAGASKAVHPLLAEACVQFQARTVSEVWPAHGPVKTNTIGESSDDKDQQANRVAGFMNYQLNEVMPGAYEAEDMAYLRLPMSGSVFKKVYHDPIYGHMDDFIPPDEFVVPYNATDLRTAPRYTHILFYFPNEVKKYQITGVYRDIEIPPPDERSLERVFYEEVKDSEGQVIWEREDDHRHTFLEQHVNLDLVGFEHKGADGKPSGLQLPYVVTVDYDSQKVLSIRRNWKEEDPYFIKREWFVHKKFIPGFGFYGYGFFHWIGSLTTAAAGALRALLDSAQFANLPAGYRPKTARGLSGEGPLAPGEWRETDLQPDELDKAFYPLPYKDPSMVLFNLMGHLEDLGRRFSSTTDVLTGSETGNVPVGTTLARIDQGQKIFNSIHKRIYRANVLEYRLLHDQIAEHLPEEGYPYIYKGVPQQIAHADFDGRIDILPVADPEVATSTQRIIQSQMLMEMATQAPDLYDRRAVHRRALAAVRIQDIDEILLSPARIPRRGPIEENMALQTGKPIKARADEDHTAHGIVHQQWFQALPQDGQNQLGAAFMAHQAEHQAWAYHIQMSQALGVPLPADVMGDKPPEDLDPDQERQLSIAAAQAVQLMPPQPSPEEQEAAAKVASIQSEDQIKTQVAQADVARKDQQAASEIQRRDALVKAEIERNDALVKGKANTELQSMTVKETIDRANAAESIARANDESESRIENLRKESDQRVAQSEAEAVQKSEADKQATDLAAKQAEQQTMQGDVDKEATDEAVLAKLEEMSNDIQELKSVEPAAPAPAQEINITVDAGKGIVTKKIVPKYSSDGRIVDLTTTEINKDKPN